jgi:hypothetical protein
MSLQLRIGPEAITSYKRLAYTPWHAIAEFVDNSTQSYFDNEEKLKEAYVVEGRGLEVSIAYDREQQILRVVDNAMGMSYDELERALHVGLPPQNTKGRCKYGMGLKTSACWLGNEWEVKTKKLGEPIGHSVLVDVEKIARGEADLQYSEIVGKGLNDHFTIVEIRKHNRAFHGRTLGKIKLFLRSMYREDFRKKILSLLWDGIPLTWEDAADQFLPDKGGKPYRKDFSFTVDGRPVSGWVGILAHGSRDTAGFSIIHYGRVVKGWPESWRPQSLYGQYQGSNDLVNQRLIGEIHLDDFDVSHTKDDILWLGDQEDQVEAGLLDHCSDYRDVAKEYRKYKDDSRRPSEIETATAIDEFKHELCSPEIVDLIEIEQIPPEAAVAQSVQQITDSVVSSRPDTFAGKIGQLTVRLFVVTDMSPNDPYVTVDARKAEEVIIIINQSHPHWAQLKGSEGVLNFIRHCTYDGIAEWQARVKASTIDPDTIKLLKDKLLRVTFEIEKHAGQVENGNHGA